MIEDTQSERGVISDCGMINERGISAVIGTAVSGELKNQRVPPGSLQDDTQSEAGITQSECEAGITQSECEAGIPQSECEAGITQSEREAGMRMMDSAIADSSIAVGSTQVSDLGARVMRSKVMEINEREA